MAELIKELVSVNLIFNHKKRAVTISKIAWKNKLYQIKVQGLHHTYQRGNTLFHVFSVADDTISFRLVLDSSSLLWTLEEVYDQNNG